MKKFENQDLQWLFNDCERIAKEIHNAGGISLEEYYNLTSVYSD